jgi:hypothetical protein
MPDGSIRVAALTHQVISEYVGTSREIVNFELNRLRRLRIMSYTRKFIDIHLPALQDALKYAGVTIPQICSGVGEVTGIGALLRQAR